LKENGAVGVWRLGEERRGEARWNGTAREARGSLYSGRGRRHVLAVIKAAADDEQRR
jgi:hypothetical protein